jgi:hypothetical protein
VAELEVLDVDPLRAQRLRDPRQHARPVGDVDAQSLQLAGLGELPLEHPPAVACRLGDPAGQEAGVARVERRLELLDPAAVISEGRAQLVGVVQEDVDPDPRICTRDARHVPQ